MLKTLVLGAAALLGQNQAPAVLGQPQSAVTTAPFSVPSSQPGGTIYLIQDAKDAKNGDAKNGNGNGKEEAKEEEKKDEEGPWRLFPEAVHGFKMTGWIYGTGVYNFTNGGGIRYNGPMTTNDQEGVYLNQFWININRGLQKDCLGWGANLDVFFGNDYLSSLSRGFENRHARGWLPQWWDNQDYGVAIPQAYVEFGNTDYNIRAGHFYTPHGYMVVQAPSNFFNTMPYGFMMTNPFTHWGVMANFKVSEQVTGMASVVNGWDALSRPVNSAAFMGQLKYSFKDSKGYMSTTAITGDEPENLGTAYSNRTLVTNLLEYKVTDDFTFALENNLLWQKNEGLATSFSWSVIPYFFYKINDCLKAGFRYEYFYDPSGFISAERVGNQNNGPVFSNGVYNGHLHAFTFGLGWAPNGSKNLMIRPEISYQMFDNNTPVQPFSNGNKDHQIFGMIGAYYLF